MLKKTTCLCLNRHLPCNNQKPMEEEKLSLARRALLEKPIDRTMIFSTFAASKIFIAKNLIDFSP